FFGRSDDQVKIRGNRVFLSEVENRMLQHPEIVTGTVTANQDAHGEIYLTGYYVPEISLEAETVKSHLKKFLPEYMIPAALLEMKELPLTANDKIDKKALPLPDRIVFSSGDQAKPRTEAEEVLLNIWKEILETERLGTKDNFFDAGGNSMRLVMMHGKIEGKFPDKVSIADIFANPTIEKLAAIIENRRKKSVLKNLLFPPDWFIPPFLGEGSISFSLTEKDQKQIEALASRYRIDSSTILLSLYGYILSALTKQKKLTIYSADSRSSDIYPVEINVKHILNFDQLFRQVKISSDRGLAELLLESRLFSSKKDRKPYHVIPHFSYSEGVPDGGIKEWELSLQCYAPPGGETELTLKYSRRQFNHQKMELLINQYMKLIQLIIQDDRKENV
ncbi:hypothetical protein JFL43_07705, partial [Viridibacillus sp. YIM B01967]